MKKPTIDPLTRRHFLQTSLFAAGAAGVGGALMLTQRHGQAADPKQTNPFAYDLSQFSRTDPKLIHYEEAKRFRCPRGDTRRLAFGPDERLYVAAGNYVSILDTSGKPVGERALTGPARAVAVAGDGTLYAGLRDHVEVFAPRQNRPAAWDSLGQRAWITGLAAAKNDVFVGDSGNRVVLHTDRSGKLVNRLGQHDADRNVPGLILPSPFLDVDIHPSGLLQVNNPGRHQVEVYTYDGHLELSWGKASAAIEGFCGCCNPISLAILPDGRIVTCEKGLLRVKVYSVHGEFESVVAGPESFVENAKAAVDKNPADGSYAALDVATDAAGRIYILDTVTNEIRIMVKKAKTAFAAPQPTNQPG